MGIMKCPMCGEELMGEKVCNHCGTDVSKLEESLCKDCNGILEKCPECNSSISPDTEICSQCGHNIGEVKNKICKCCDKKADNEPQKDAEYQTMNNDGNENKSPRKIPRKLLYIIPCAILVFVFLIVYTQVHIYADATCTEPKTCRLCRKTEGHELYHKWLRECGKVETCERCGLEQGEPLDHSWQEATCEAPKTCFRCQKTEGEALGHQETWETTVEATLTENGYESKVCEICHETFGSVDVGKKTPEVESDHYNFGALEFIEYFQDYLSSATLNMDVEIDVQNTELADRAEGGIAFSIPLIINSDEEIELLMAEMEDGYVQSIFLRCGNNEQTKGHAMALFAVMGGSLTDSNPQAFLVNLFGSIKEKGIFFYGKNGIRFTQIPDDNYYILGATPIPIE